MPSLIGPSHLFPACWPSLRKCVKHNLRGGGRPGLHLRTTGQQGLPAHEHRHDLGHEEETMRIRETNSVQRLSEV